MARQLSHLGERHDSRVSYLTGKPLADKAHNSTSKTYSHQRDYRFDTKTFTELRNAMILVGLRQQTVVPGSTPTCSRPLPPHPAAKP